MYVRESQPVVQQVRATSRHAHKQTLFRSFTSSHSLFAYLCVSVTLIGCSRSSESETNREKSREGEEVGECGVTLLFT